MLQRPQVAAPGIGEPLDDVTLKRLPLIAEHLTTDCWEDGTERERSSILMVREGGAWKAGLLDRATGRSLWVSGSSLPGLLDALEKRLAAPQPDWRNLKQAGKKK